MLEYKYEYEYDKHVLTLFISKIKSNKIVIFGKFVVQFLMILHINVRNYITWLFFFCYISCDVCIFLFSILSRIFSIYIFRDFFVRHIWWFIYLIGKIFLSQFEMENCEVDKYFDWWDVNRICTFNWLIY